MLDRDTHIQIMAPFVTTLVLQVAGALNLSNSALSTGLELDFLVLFSSASAVLGLAGEPGYAAANGCLDGLAWYVLKV